MKTGTPPANAAVVRRRWTIRAQLVALVLAVALPAAGLVAYALIAAANETRNAAFLQVQHLAVSAANRLDYVVRDGEALLQKLADRPHIRALDPRRCDPLIDSLVALNPLYTTLAVRDLEGNPVCSFIRQPLGADPVARLRWFEEGLTSGRFTAGDAFLGRQTGRWVSVLTHPVRDDSGEVSGLLALPIDLRLLQDRLFDALPDGSLVAVLDRRNTYLMRSIDPDRWIGKPLPGPQAERATGRRSGETFETTGVDGFTRMYAVAVVPSTGWRVFAALPKDVVFASHRLRLAQSAAIGAGVLIVVIALSYGIGSAIARPIGELARAASDVAGGGSFSLGPDTVTSEVEVVASQLNRLAGERERVRSERAALVDHYERLLKSTRDIYVLTDASGRIVDFNDVAVAIYGYSPQELKAMSIADLRAPRERAAAMAEWGRSILPEGALFETIHQRRDGSTFPVEVSASAIEIDGRMFRQGLVRDITSRKAAEDMLRRQNEELDRFNRAAVGRELDVIELKRRVNGLSRELGREPPYPLAFLDGPSPSDDEPQNR